ncbi:uncharacterized protein LOC124266512 [Haliotis rubra]|uniref:uncharacterized protein LOC124266512 n=1 Tax=Haliotis rubra TaxID=36100 RepID=UPI001EE524FE|nr:uncharacterized protein LOC124266512 [Haliotis rubra]
MSKTESNRGHTPSRGFRKDKLIASKPRSSTFATNVGQNYTDHKKKVSCHFCWKAHDIDDCEAFKQKTLNDKRTYLREKHMCYGCYGYNHAVKGCLRKRICRKCGKRHPTALHDDNFQMRHSSQHSTDTKYQTEGNGNQKDLTETVSSSCNSTKSDSVETVLQSILPVIVRQQALQPQKVIPSDGDGPFAVLYKHGWTINGPLHVKFNSERNTLVCNRVILCEKSSVKECLAPSTIVRIFERDFSEQDLGKVPGEKGYSREDRRFMETAEEQVKYVNGHYELPLPFRDDTLCANNRTQAQSRAKWQRKKMLQNEQYYKDYVGFVDNLLEKGFAYKIPEGQLSAESQRIWYLPHHGIYHPKKPTKIRVVFDCSAKYEGTSLNDRLLQGPDLTNSLIGVLTRFRAERIAFMADIESMFYQVKVPVTQHDSLRFLWWPNGDLNADLQEYRMGVHIFGAVSSPSISNFALKATANRAEERFGSLVADVIRKNFYVDDCLKSVENDKTAIKLIYDVRAACADGGFKLTKFTSNSRNVLKSIPVGDHSKEIQTRDLDYDELPIERALGMKWYVNTDTFGFSTDFIEKPVTRRGLLSTVSSLYDPLGIVTPIILPAKRILQELCANNDLDWDDDIPGKYEVSWKKWLKELKILETLKIERCLKPAEFGKVVSKQVHVFSDASSVGYGCVAYLRLSDAEQNVHVAFLMGKSRLTPVKPVSIPRLELTAATVAVQIAQLMLKELDTDIDSVTYFTDSTTVLHYINSEKKRYPVFVANRVRLIRDYSGPKDWKYVESDENPADIASRGASTAQLLAQSDWFEGPQFLWRSESEWNLKQPGPAESVVEETVATTCVSPTKMQCEGLDTLIKHYSSWYRLKRGVVIYLQLINNIKARIRKRKGKVESGVYNNKPLFTVEKLECAENIIMKFVQSKSFDKEIHVLTAVERGRVPKHSSVYKLDPFINNGILKVGGRLSKSQIPDEMKHQILLPSKHHVTSLIIQDIHKKLGHVGRNHVLSKLREKYWVIRANATVRNILSHCVTCRRLKMPPCEQKMSDLPFSRVNPAPPFTYSGVDFFGPHTIKEGRKQMKRYGALFTCLASRAIHIETANSLDTDSFIHALRRFIARRGPVKEIWCDNGTNFIGAARELKEALAELDQNSIHSHLLQANIDWKFNPPSASHMGGVWERMIGSVRKILSPMLYEFGDRLDDEAYRTLLCEVEAIVNSRPLTTVSSDATDLNPLTPNHLLMIKSNVFIAPQEHFFIAIPYSALGGVQIVNFGILLGAVLSNLG